MAESVPRADAMALLASVEGEQLDEVVRALRSIRRRQVRRRVAAHTAECAPTQPDNDRVPVGTTGTSRRSGA
jgi:hypothetical protein